MGLILDSSILIADERGKFDMAGFLGQFPNRQPVIAAITASELLHGVERAKDIVRRSRRQQHVEQILASVYVQPFDLFQARCHARIWADLEERGLMIGPHDLHGILGSTSHIQHFARFVFSASLMQYAKTCRDSNSIRSPGGR